MMKKYFIAGLVLAFVSIAGHAQKGEPVDATLKGNVDNALTNYYKVKDALVGSDPVKASSGAAELLASVSAISPDKMTVKQKEIWNNLEGPIRTNTELIGQATDLEKQREYFAKLSDSMFSLVVTFKGNSQPAYQHYCPMKKATWLSASKEVRNPYYGDKMLDCGSVRYTLKKN